MIPARYVITPGLLLCAAGLVLLWGCGNGNPTPDTGDAAGGEDPIDCAEPLRVDLVDNEQWTVLAEAEDPFTPERTEESVTCGEDTYGAIAETTGIWFEVITQDCNWMTARTQTIEAVRPGEAVLIRVWRDVINAGEGLYTVAVAVGEEANVVAESTHPVPSNQGLVQEIVFVDAGWEAGIPVFFHVRNHGVNTWGLVDMTVERDPMTMDVGCAQ